MSGPGDYRELGGDEIGPRELVGRHARELAERLLDPGIEFATLIECRREGELESVVFEVDVEVPQKPAYEILPRERVRAAFAKDSNSPPVIEALRLSFPEVPHVNFVAKGIPPTLCLDDEPPEDVVAKWTAPRFVRRLREWLALTAKGKLHQDDQRLEPMLLGPCDVIALPHDLRDARSDDGQLYVFPCSRKGDSDHFYVALREQPEGASGVAMLASVHRGEPRVQERVRYRPTTLVELEEFANHAGAHRLLDELGKRVSVWCEDESLREALVVAVLLAPKRRTAAGPVEEVETWAFALQAPVQELAVKLGFWGREGGHFSRLMERGRSHPEDVHVEVLNPCDQLCASSAAAMSGSDPLQLSMATVGVGALGSQVVMNLVRSGVGRWTLIDHDRLFPHNLARHSLDGRFIGSRKAETVALCADSILADGKVEHLSANVLQPGDEQERLASVFSEADLLLDMSASIPVARRLTIDVQAEGRRASVFLNPRGADAVLLMEDTARSSTLDGLEMQYYRAVAGRPELAGHLAGAGRRRYAGSCSDRANIMSQHHVALHAALAGNALVDQARENEARATVWRADDAGNVKRIDIDTHPVLRGQLGDWTFVTDIGLLQKLHDFRSDRLPNETGGVLLGSFDTQRRIVYVVDTLPSPPDSTEWPTLYIRGCKGLREHVAKVSELTMGAMDYIGEWHAHPAGVAPAASDDDKLVFSWITEVMDLDGLPAVMMIVSDPGRESLFVGSIDRRESPLPRSAN